MSRPVSSAGRPLPQSRDRFVDDVKVDLACTQPYGAARLTVRERGLAIKRLTPVMSANQIADLLGLARRTVQRYQAGEVAHANARPGCKRPASSRRPAPNRPPGRKLTAADVAAIRTQFEQGEAKKALGRRYGVSATMIRRIVTGAAWTQVAAPRRAAA